MAVRILMSKPDLPYTRSAYQGFSWTTFIWGPFPPLFRADGVGLLIAIPLVLVSFAVPILPFLIWAFFYNMNHLNRLANNGWTPVQSVPTWAPGSIHDHGQGFPRPAISAGTAAEYAVAQSPVQPAQIDAAADDAVEEVGAAEVAVEEIAVGEIGGIQRPAALESGTPAGWYADPYSAFGERWWDGNAWTEQCR